MRIPFIVLPSVFLVLAAKLCGGETTPSERHLLIGIKNIPANEQTDEGAFGYNDYNRQRIISLVRNTALLLATPEEVAQWQSLGFDPEVLLESDNELDLYRRALYGPALKLDPIYHTYEQIVARAEALQAQCPELMTRIQIGETTQFHRPIYAYRLSNDAAKVQDRPAVLFDGCHHADEIMGAEIVLALMEKLMAGYGTDAAVTRWLDTIEIYLVPVVNVDGHHYVTSGHDPRWRKNARDVNRDGVTGVYPEGVDVNRGYSFNWALGGSNDPVGPSYRGAHPFSEAENRAMRNLADQRQLLLSISYHSQGEVIYYPWIWGNLTAPDDKVIKNLANDVAVHIKRMDGGGTYGIAPGGPSSQSYPWFYGRRGVIDMIIETGKGTHIFSAAEVPGIIGENLKGIAALLEHAAGPGLSVRVTDAVTGFPLEAEVWIPRIDNETVDRRRSDGRFGRARRLLVPGTYYLVISREGYATAVLPAQQVDATGWTSLEVALQPSGQ
ncbi:MAG: hypothetical protein K9N01_07230 [Cephaloticoccus sp.]|nr:hypothetical protein [Cephaloticoccus sp.]